MGLLKNVTKNVIIGVKMTGRMVRPEQERTQTPDQIITRLDRLIVDLSRMSEQQPLPRAGLETMRRELEQIQSQLARIPVPREDLERSKLDTAKFLARDLINDINNLLSPQQQPGTGATRGPQQQPAPAPVRVQAFVYNVTMVDSQNIPHSYRVTLPEPLPREPSGRYGPMAQAKLLQLCNGSRLYGDPAHGVSPAANVVEVDRQGNPLASDFNRRFDDLSNVTDPKRRAEYAAGITAGIDQVARANPGVPRQEVIDMMDQHRRVESFTGRYRGQMDPSNTASGPVDIVAVQIPGTPQAPVPTQKRRGG